MFTIQFAKNPIYSSKDNKTIDLLVKFNEMQEIMPFTSSEFDNTNYGQLLFHNAIAEIYGIVEPYIEPKIITSVDQPISTGTQTL